MPAPKNRPYFNLSGPEVAAKILAGDKRAIAEGAHRSNRQVKAALEQVTSPKASTPKAKPAPAPRAKGQGSRGGDPVKAQRAKLADQVGPRGSSAWWKAYRASKNVSTQLLATV